MSSDLQLGDRVTFTDYLSREHDMGHHFWVDVPCRRTSGVVVGKRTLTDGESVTEVDDWSHTSTTVGYRPIVHFTAYLVAFDLRRKPVLVRPESIEKKRGVL